MPPDRVSEAQAEANVFYPAVTADELANDALMIANYRRSLGRERMLWAGCLVLAGAWAVDYLRRGK